MSDGIIGLHEILIFLSDLSSQWNQIQSVLLTNFFLITAKMNGKILIVSVVVHIFSSDRVYTMVITCKLLKWKCLVQFQKKTIRVWRA